MSIANRLRGMGRALVGDGSTEQDADRRIELEQVKARGERTKGMMLCAGWADYEMFLRNRFDGLQAQLRAAHLKDVPALQAQLRELETVLSLAPQLVEAGKAAEEELKLRAMGA